MNEIGSEFDFDLKILQKPPHQLPKFFARNSYLFLSTGRDSIVYAIKCFKIKNILLPSYIEHILVDLIQHENVQTHFFKVNPDLSINLDSIKNNIKNVDALFITHYFGFIHNLSNIRNLCNKNKVLLIEDCVQSALSTNRTIPVGNFGDFSFNSLRKFIGIPDGSIAYSKKKIPIKESTLHKKFVKLRIAALVGKYKYLNNFQNFSRFYFKEAFEKPEILIDIFPKPSPMSLYSKKILKRTDFNSIIKIRRKNFKFLLSHLMDISFYKKLPVGICPLGFPIIMSNRTKVKKFLIQNKIYPPIHWQLSEQINKNKFRDSWKISKNILTLPIDQRYTIDDMKRIVMVFRNL